MIKTSEKIGTLVIILFFIFGFYCFVDVCRTLNIKSRVIGYFYSEPEIVRINDFEYDINALIFSNTGTENQYYATANAKPVSNFDSTKQYTITINGIRANKSSVNNGYIDCDFTNKFLSTKSEDILTDTLNIKINFYKEGTKIVFITNNGEQAVKLWTSFIAKNGFNLKIVEDNFKTTIKADNVNIIMYYINNDLYKTETCELNKEHSLVIPLVNDGYIFTGWNETIVEGQTTTLENIEKYTPTQTEIKNFYGYILKNNSLVIEYDNKTGKSLNVDLVKLSNITSGGVTTTEIKNTYWSEIMPKGQGIITYDNTGIWGPFTLLFNNGNEINQISYTYCLKTENEIGFGSETKVLDSNGKWPYNTTTISIFSVNNRINYIKITLQ